MAEYIEREALQADIRDSYQKLHEIYNGLKFENERAICGAELTTFCEILMRIKDWPAADVVEERHGEWRTVTEDNGSLTAECTECDAVFDELSMFEFALNYNYCPNCGARMGGE